MGESLADRTCKIGVRRKRQSSFWLITLLASHGTPNLPRKTHETVRDVFAHLFAMSSVHIGGDW